MAPIEKRLNFQSHAVMVVFCSSSTKYEHICVLYFEVIVEHQMYGMTIMTHVCFRHNVLGDAGGIEILMVIN